jgi:hypothetical protein
MPANHSNPISLSDSQLQQVLAAAAVLHVADRDAFLRSVAERLRHQQVGDGAVGRAVREAQREYFRAPRDTNEQPHHNSHGGHRLV